MSSVTLLSHTPIFVRVCVCATTRKTSNSHDYGPSTGCKSVQFKSVYVNFMRKSCQESSDRCRLSEDLITELEDGQQKEVLTHPPPRPLMPPPQSSNVEPHLFVTSVLHNTMTTCGMEHPGGREQTFVQSKLSTAGLFPIGQVIV